MSQIMKILNRSKKWVMKGLFVVKLEIFSREMEGVGHSIYHLNQKGTENVKVQYRRICKEKKTGNVIGKHERIQKFLSEGV